MSLALRRLGELSSKQIADLNAALAVFYKNPPASYYQIANWAADQYDPRTTPFHCDLVHRVWPNSSVLEIGCGMAHLCPHVQSRGGTYTGIDYSEPLIAENRRRFPQSRFFQLGTPIEEKFDLVVSLYTIEHVADPLAYLERMWTHCRPGGLLAIICPEFINCPAFAPSIFFGRTPRRLRAKLKSFNLVDACWHLIDLKVSGVLWQKRARKCSPGAFWINLRPRVLYGADFASDTEAVHLVQLRDLVWFFEQKGGTILATSLTVPNVAADVLQYNCYVVAKKPDKG